MLNDLKFAFRQLAKAPGFTVTIVATLALGIGACVTIFSLVNSVLLTTYAADYDRSVVIGHTRPPDATPLQSVSPNTWFIWEAELKSFELLMAHHFESATLIGEGEPLRIIVRGVTRNFFRFHEKKLVLGRNFTPDEHAAEKADVVILSHELWQRVFGGRKDIVNRTVQINRAPYTVVGVTVDGDFPAGEGADLFYTGSNALLRRYQGHRFLSVRGVLKPGVTLAQAQAELDVVTARLAQQLSDTHQGLAAFVTPVRDYATRNSRPMLLTLFGAVLCVLLIACANIASLLIVRATVRQREISLRLALGASRARIARQLFSESALLALLGGGAGALIAQWAGEAIRSYPLIRVMGPENGAMDGRMIAFTIGLSVVATLLFGVAPAWLSSRVDLNESLKQGTRGSTESEVRGRLRRWLVVFEVACATVLLAAAGLFIRSFVQSARVELGLVPKNAFAMNVADILQDTKYNAPEQRIAFTDAVLARIANLPGVEVAGVTGPIAFSARGEGGIDYEFNIDGRAADERDRWPRTRLSIVSPGYFPATGIRLIRGRIFTERDDARASPVVVINATLARKHFAGENPVGHRILLPSSDRNSPDAWFEIVGVVADATQKSPEQPIMAQTYRPYAQRPVALNITFVIRTKGEVPGLAHLLRATVHGADPNQAVGTITPLQDILDSRVSDKRFELHMMSVFSLLALAIAMVGIYGVIAYSVSQRTTEIGIRMALGAQSTDVARLVLSQGARLVGLGLLLGFAGALAVGRMIEARLFEVSAHDPLTLGAITLLLASVAALACWLPARRATKVDPIVALRAE